MAPISQREARRLMKRVGRLEEIIIQQRGRWSGDYPGGTEICSIDASGYSGIVSAVSTARKLSHAVVAINTNDKVIRFVALPHPSEEIS